MYYCHTILKGVLWEKTFENTEGKGEHAVFYPIKEKFRSLSGVENIVGKRENAGYQLFLLFPQFFQKAFFSGLLKVGIVE